MSQQPFFTIAVPTLASHLATLLEGLRKDRPDELAEIDRVFQPPEQFIPYYVHPYAQNINPADSHEEDTGLVARTSALELFSRFFLIRDRYQHVLVLSDSGMGKTSLMVTLRLLYLARMVRPPLKVELFKLSADTMEKIEKIKNPAETVLLLDGLDEDREAWNQFYNRLQQILRGTTAFRKVVITCRTQFFPREHEEDGRIPGVVKLSGFSCSKLFLSPFDDTQVEEYLLRRFNDPAKRTRAHEIVDQMRSLKFRPMLLSYVEDLLDHDRPYNNMYDVYQVMVEEWLDRELRKGSIQSKNPLRTACARIARELYQKKERQLSFERVRELYAGNDIVRELEYMTIEGRSLLHCTSEGMYKFAHYSILEFFIANILVDPKQTFQTENSDQTKVFLSDLLVHHRRKFFRNVDLSHVVIHGADVSNADFFKANLGGASVTGSKLRRSNFEEADLSNARIAGCDLQRSKFGRVNFTKTVFHETNLQECDFKNADLSSARFEACELTGAILEGVQLRKGSLQSTKIENMEFRNIDFQECDLTNVKMEGSSFDSCLFEGTQLLFARLHRCRFSAKTNFAKAQLDKAHFDRATLIDCNLDEAHGDGMSLSGSTLNGASFCRVQLLNSNFNDVVAHAVSFINARILSSQFDRGDFTDANFDGAKLTGGSAKSAVFNGTTFRGAICELVDFSEANVRGATFDHADLRRSKLERATLLHSSLVSADMSGARAQNIILRNIKAIQLQGKELGLVRSSISDSIFESSRLSSADLSETVCRRSSFNSMTARESLWRRASLEEVSFVRADLSKARFEEAKLTDVDFSLADLRGTNFSKVQAERVIWQGAIYSAETVFPVSIERSKIGALGPGAHIRSAVLKERILPQIDLTGADLARSDLSNSVLTKAKFGGADLTDTSLEAADLTNAQFGDANMRGTNLERAQLADADLSSARIEGARFAGAYFNKETRFPEEFDPTRHGLIPTGQFPAG